MIKIEAPTLQEAYSQAAAQLSCSVIDLEINILQNGSNGFLGMFKKNAIIEATRKGSKPLKEVHESKEQHILKKQTPLQKEETSVAQRTDVTSSSASQEDSRRNDRNKRNKNRRNKQKQKEFNKAEETPVVEEKKAQPIVKSKPTISNEAKTEPRPPRSERPPFAATEASVHYEKRMVDDVLDEVRKHVTHLFQYSCFTLETPVVSKYNDDTILIEFAGEDAALLIGKEGYRYKALSYLLYNWINLKYGLNIRLEIAEFLKNQEEMIEKYLAPVIERIRINGRGQTKILDGVLIKIALESLRDIFPEKYVGIKSGREGGKFIVVNDFNRKNA